ncbi:MAG: hypothetical protein D6744_15060, partial [Planctomycetota bacterium]
MQAAVFRVSVFALALASCAPRSLPATLDHFAVQERVRDAGVRRSRAAWYLRFDAALLHDLEAVLTSDGSRPVRQQAERTLRAAGDLAVRSVRGEILRLSKESREQLARRAGCAASPDVLADEIERRARDALDTELRRLATATDEVWHDRLDEIRQSVEPLPDDRDRTLRRVLLAGFAPAAAAGIEQVERDIRQRT